MGQFSKWLLHEDQKEWFDYLFALVLNIAFVALTALLLWPFGKATIALRLAKGYWIFWTVLIVSSIVMLLAQRLFRMDLYERFDAYVLSGLALSAFLQIGWSAFAALVIRSAVGDTSAWLTITVYGVAVVACYVASVMVGVFYMGSLYRLVNSALAILAFVLFSLWPSAGATIYGWFFELF